MGIFTRTVESDDHQRVVARPYNAPRPITAAAARMSVHDKTEIEALNKRRTSSKWQDDCWEYYDLIGEVKYAVLLIGSIISRIRIYAAVNTEDNAPPSPIGQVDDVDEDLKQAALDAMRLLATGQGGTGGLLSTIARNMFVVGECYLVQEPISNTGKTRWQARSISEVSVTKDRGQTRFRVQRSRDAKGDEITTLPPHAFVGRMWNMHPRFSDDADSSMRGLLELMDELLLLNKTARATMKSRLNAGILLLPDDLSNIAQMDGVEIIDPEDPDYVPLDRDDDEDFEEALQYAMVQPISDESSPSAVVPLIIRGPAESLSLIRHISVARSFDPAHADRADRVLDRILAGLDLPKEMVAGVADSKYANATVVEEALLSQHIEPLILQIVDSLSTVFLTPVLLAQGFSEEQIRNVVVWYDPSAITTKPSKSEAANVGYTNRVLSGRAWRRANGFSDSDAPTELEIAQRMAVERGALSEPVAEALLRTLIPSLLERVRVEQQQQAGDLGGLLENLDGDDVPAPGEDAPGGVDPDLQPTAPDDLIEPDAI